jgi:hypothetical protein
MRWHRPWQPYPALVRAEGSQSRRAFERASGAAAGCRHATEQPGHGGGSGRPWTAHGRAARTSRRGRRLPPPNLTVRWQITRHGGRSRTDTKTPQSRRTVPLPQVVADALSARRTEFGHGTDGSPFATVRGNPYRSDYYIKLFRAVVGRTTLPKGTTSHDLRHHYASVLLAAVSRSSQWRPGSGTRTPASCCPPTDTSCRTPRSGPAGLSTTPGVPQRCPVSTNEAADLRKCLTGPC